MPSLTQPSRPCTFGIHYQEGGRPGYTLREYGSKLRRVGVYKSVVKIPQGRALKNLNSMAQAARMDGKKVNTLLLNQLPYAPTTRIQANELWQAPPGIPLHELTNLTQKHKYSAEGHTIQMPQSVLKLVNQCLYVGSRKTDWRTYLPLAGLSGLKPCMQLFAILHRSHTDGELEKSKINTHGVHTCTLVK